MTYDETIIDAYNRRAKSLFAYDCSGNIQGRAGNSWASSFWAGFDGMKTGVRVPPRGSLARPWYDAGRKVRVLSKEPRGTRA